MPNAGAPARHPIPSSAQSSWTMKGSSSASDITRSLAGRTPRLSRCRPRAIRARGASLYCTLEPCSHTGRTGPCSVAVADAGIRRVVVATGDPFPQVAGRGFAYLRGRGIEVTTGVGRREARLQNAPFFRAVELGRPWVHAEGRHEPRWRGCGRARDNARRSAVLRRRGGHNGCAAVSMRSPSGQPRRASTIRC